MIKNSFGVIADVQDRLIEYTRQLETHICSQKIRQQHIFQERLHSQKTLSVQLLKSIANKDKAMLTTLIAENIKDDQINLDDIVRRIFHVESPTIKPPQPVVVQSNHNSKSIENKPKQVSKPVQANKKTGIIKSVIGLFHKEQQSNATQMILPDKPTKHYFCKIKNRYIFEGEEEEQQTPPPPPPPKSSLNTVKVEQAPKTELQALTAPPAFHRNKKKAGKKQTETVHSKIETKSEEYSFQSLRLYISRELDSLKHEIESKIEVTHQKADDYESLYTRLRQEEEISQEVSKLLKSTYELIIETQQKQVIQIPNTIGIVPQKENREQLVSDLKDRMRMLNKEIQNLKETLDEKQTRIDELQSNLRTQVSIDVLQTELKTKNMIIEDLENQLQIRLSTINNLQAEIYQNKLILSNTSIKNSEKETIENCQRTIRQKNSLIENLENNQNAIKRYCNAILTTRSSLNLLNDSINQQNVLLEKIKKKRNNLLAKQDLIGGEFENVIESTTNQSFLKMSDMINQIILKSLSNSKVLQQKNNQLYNIINLQKSKYLQQKTYYQGRLSSLNNQYTKAKVTLDSLKGESIESRNRLEQLKDVKSRQDREIEKMKHDNVFNKNLVEQLTKNIGSLNKKIEEYVGVIEKIRSQKNGLQSQIQVLSQNSSEMQEVLIAQNAEKQQLVAEITNKLDQIKQLQLQMTRKNQQNQNTRAQISQLRNELEAKQIALLNCENKVKQLSTLIKHNEEQASKNKTNWQQKLREKEEELQKNQNIINQLSQELNNKQSQLDALQQQNLKEKQQLNIKLSDAQALSQKLAEQLSESKEINQKNLSNYEQLYDVYNEEVSNLAKYTQAYQELHQNYQQKLNQLTTIKVQLQKISNENQTLTISSKQLQASRLELEQLKGSHEQLKKKLQEYDIQNKQLLKKLQQAHFRSEQLLQENRTIHQNSVLAKTNFEEQLRLLQSEIEANRNQHIIQLSQLEHQLQQFQSTIQQNEEVIVDMDGQIAEKQTHIDELIQTNLHHEKQISELNTKINLQAEQINVLQEKLKNGQLAVQQISSQFTQKNKQLNNQIRQYKQLLEQLATKQAQNEISIEQYQASLTDKQKLLSGLSQEYAQLKEENSRTKEEAARTKQQKQILRDIINTLSKEKEDLKAQLETTEDMAHIELENVKLEKDQAITTLNHKTKQYMVKLAEYQTTIKQNEQLIERLNEEIEKYQNKGHIQQSNQNIIFQKRQAQLINQINLLRQTNIRYQQFITQLNDQIKQDKYESSQSKSYYQQKLQKFEEQIVSLTTEKTEYNEARQNLQTNYTIEIERRNQKLQQCYKQIKQCTYDLNMCKHELKEKQEQWSRKEHNYLTSLREKQRNIDILKSTKQNEEDQSELQTIIEHQEAEINSLNDQIRRAGEVNNHLKEQNQILNQRISEQSQRKLKYEQNVNKMNQQLSEQRSNSHKLKELLLDRQNRQKMLEDKLDKQSLLLQGGKPAEFKKLSQQLRLAEDYNKQLLDQKVSLMRLNQTLNQQVSTLQKQIDKLNKQAKISPPQVVPPTLPNEKPVEKNMPTPNIQPVSSTIYSSLSKLFLTQKEQQTLK